MLRGGNPLVHELASNHLSNSPNYMAEAAGLVLGAIVLVKPLCEAIHTTWTSHQNMGKDAARFRLRFSVQQARLSAFERILFTSGILLPEKLIDHLAPQTRADMLELLRQLYTLLLEYSELQKQKFIQTPSPIPTTESQSLSPPDLVSHGEASDAAAQRALSWPHKLVWTFSLKHSTEKLVSEFEEWTERMKSLLEVGWWSSLQPMEQSSVHPNAHWAEKDEQAMDIGFLKNIGLRKILEVPSEAGASGPSMDSKDIVWRVSPFTSLLRNSPAPDARPRMCHCVEHVPGPGIGDIIGFGLNGVVILRNTISIQSFKVLNDFGASAGWKVDRHVRCVADTTGDKQADIVGFGEKGVFVSVNQGNNTFADPPRMVVMNFSYEHGGWRVDKHIRFMADIRNTGRTDIIGFGNSGVLISRNDGRGNFGSVELILRDFGYSAGWRLKRHLRFLADVTGDGLLDIVGFGEEEVFVARNNGDGTFQSVQAVLNSLCYSKGWRVQKHPRFVTDLTGDGTADLVGFGNAGVYVALNKGSGTFTSARVAVKDFGYDAGGWRIEKHPRFITDLTGNGRGDVIGFGNDGVYISLNNGDGTFQPVQRVVENFGYDQGWRVEMHPRSVVDLTGDGCADIIGFGEEAVYVSYNLGRGRFSSPKKLTSDFAYNRGWTLENTVRFVANVYRS